MAKNVTRLENEISHLKNEQLRYSADLGALAQRIIELKKVINEMEADIHDLKRGVDFEDSDNG